jgi:hypothetical protein
VDFGEVMAGLRVDWTSGNVERSWDWTFRRMDVELGSVEERRGEDGGCDVGAGGDEEAGLCV